MLQAHVRRHRHLPPGVEKLLCTFCCAGISSISQLCPLSRYPGGCDYVAYSADEVCCPESSALPSLLVKPLPFTRPRTLPPPPSTEVG